MAQQDPFKAGTAGANAFRAAYDRLKTEADLARKNIGQDFSGAYQQLRQQGYGQGLGAAAQAGLSGGQAAGMRSTLGAQQMGALGNLMQGQERAMREQKAGEASIYSNALLEGQQAQQMEQQQQQYEFQREQQIQSILDSDLDDAARERQLTAVGLSPQEAQDLIRASNQPGFGDYLARFFGRTFAPFGQTGSAAGTVGGNALTGFARGMLFNPTTPFGQTVGNLYRTYDTIRSLFSGNNNNNNNQ